VEQKRDLTIIGGQRKEEKVKLNAEMKINCLRRGMLAFT